MSRGARRRRGKVKRKPIRSPFVPEGVDDLDPQAGKANRKPPGPPRRGRGGLAVSAPESALDSMSTRPTRLQTLPPDGIVLEEVIAEMEAEYGFPATPQEYRLIVKVVAPDEAPPVAEPQGAEPGADSGAAPRKRRRRRRRPKRPAAEA